METVAMLKKAMRRTMLERRARFAADPGCYAAASAAACGNVMALPAWASAETIAIYAPFRNEVDTAVLFAAGRREGKDVLYPRCVTTAAGEPWLEWYRVGTSAGLVPGAYGILEPDITVCRQVETPPSLLVVPALAMSVDGYRLGYGRGYYDRRLGGLGADTVVTAGLIFSCQLSETLPHEAWDARLTYVVTEEGVIICSK